MFPNIIRIRQKASATAIENVSRYIEENLEKTSFNFSDFEGKKVGITAGSRGISNYSKILKTIVDKVKDAKGYPIIIPSMGSHGGGTIEGQLEVLASLGITENTVGAPIAKNIHVERIGQTPGGIPVYCNVEAIKVDKLIVLNRVKPHTDFEGQIESGICKMFAIGLGSVEGCVNIHSHALVNGYEEIITGAAELMIKQLPVAFAVAVLENWKGETADVKILLPCEIIEKEKEVLKEVKSSMIKLPFKAIDVLVIGEIGKNISGTGMDTKVVGRIMVKGQKEPDYPKIGRIVVLNLTTESHGNAIGIGLADITTEKVFNSIDIRSTSLNSISSMSPEQGRLPCILASDKEAIHSALLTLGAVDAHKVRLVYIQNTLNLENFAVSKALVDEVQKNEKLEVMGTLEEMRFEHDGTLVNFRGDNYAKH
ncbi:MAG: hypothetical protein JM58_12360 [Peptococcaceae bacterium BICA1-8]|nr:MAG: hypothetical protein JM58_12360 [Peptococcaceae bacterium BICA1-8]